MVIYEVNLIVKEEIIDDFNTWLVEHVDEMLRFPGFKKAEILQEEGSVKHLSVRYYLSHREYLEDYLQNHAQKMRGQGILQFKDKFSASRRILHLQKSKKT